MNAAFHGWLLAVFFWTGLSLGSAALLMIHHLSGGRWGFAIRRVLEAAVAPFPAMALAFLPVLFGLEQLYPWARELAVAHDEILQKRQAYMNPAGFAIRSGLVYLLWIWLAWRLRRLSRMQDGTASAAPTRSLRSVSGPGLVLVPLSATLAYVDWVMSLEEHWYSTVFGLLLCVGQTNCALALGIVAGSRLGNLIPEGDAHLLRQMGNLMLAMVMLWTYLMFAQFVIIWLGNLPHETGWYLRRTGGGWKWVINGVLLFHFAVPFAVLLFRQAKQRRGVLAGLAMILLGAQAAFAGWMILPPARGTGAIWLAMLALGAVGALWSWRFVRSLRSAPLQVMNDPRLKAHD